jgi:hypothetical protein
MRKAVYGAQAHLFLLCLSGGKRGIANLRCFLGLRWCEGGGKEAGDGW